LTRRIGAAIEQSGIARGAIIGVVMVVVVGMPMIVHMTVVVMMVPIVPMSVIMMMIKRMFD
jgi:hypothetical protein